MGGRGVLWTGSLGSCLLSGNWPALGGVSLRASKAPDAGGLVLWQRLSREGREKAGLQLCSQLSTGRPDPRPRHKRRLWGPEHALAAGAAAGGPDHAESHLTRFPAWPPGPEDLQASGAFVSGRNRGACDVAAQGCAGRKTPPQPAWQVPAQNEDPAGKGCPLQGQRQAPSPGCPPACRARRPEKGHRAEPCGSPRPDAAALCTWHPPLPLASLQRNWRDAGAVEGHQPPRGRHLEGPQLPHLHRGQSARLSGLRGALCRGRPGPWGARRRLGSPGQRASL